MTLLRYLWAGPNTLLGLAAVLLARTTGGGWSVHSGVVEAHVNTDRKCPHSAD